MTKTELDLQVNIGETPFKAGCDDCKKVAGSVEDVINEATTQEYPGEKPQHIEEFENACVNTSCANPSGNTIIFNYEITKADGSVSNSGTREIDCPQVNKPENTRPFLGFGSGPFFMPKEKG